MRVRVQTIDFALVSFERWSRELNQYIDQRLSRTGFHTLKNSSRSSFDKLVENRTERHCLLELDTRRLCRKTSTMESSVLLVISVDTSCKTNCICMDG